MFRFFWIFIVFFSISPWKASATLAYTNKHHFNLELLENWAFKEKSQGKRLLLAHPQGLADVVIVTFSIKNSLVATDDLSLANVLSADRASRYYDGWILAYKRDGTHSENVQANVDSSYLSVYSKYKLNSDMETDQRIVSEYVYIKDNNVYLIKINSHKKYWNAVKHDLKKLIQSFWIGEGKRKDVIAKNQHLHHAGKQIPAYHQHGEASNKHFVQSDID